jgi:transcriptional regulator with XRE-family HTH domain
MVTTKSNQRIARQVGAALRRVREERECRQHRVAAAAGISRRLLAAYEGGRQLASVAALTTLLTVLDCTAEDFGRHLGPWGLP